MGSAEHVFRHLKFLPHWLFQFFLHGSLKLIVGGMIDGVILGLLFYFPVRYLLKIYEAKRKEKRRVRKAQLLMQQTQTQQTLNQE